MKTNLVLAFSSFHVDSDPNYEREEEYALCYEQLLRVLPENFTVLFCDNTVSDVSELKNERLKNVLKSNLKMFYNNNVGTTNKGLGELDMLVTAMKKITFSSYETISYLTGRRIITCPYVFDKMTNLKKDAIMSNPPIYSINTGNEYPSGEKLYNDMFFGMKSSLMIEYAKFVETLICKPTHLGSEQFLYKFVNEVGVDFEWIESLGFIRNDWQQTSSEYTREQGNAQWI
jgi:hypothetical protein